MSTIHKAVDLELLAQFYNVDIQKDLQSLIDFNAQLSYVANASKDVTSYQIRLQWWMNSIYDVVRAKKTGSPIADDFGIVANKYKITSDMLGAFLNSRNICADSVLFKNIKDMEEYAKNTGGIFAELWAIITGEKEQIESFKNLGTAWALVGLVRNINFNKALNRQNIPEDLLEAGEQQAIVKILDVAESYLKAIKKRKFSPYLLLFTMAKDYIYRIKVAKGDLEQVDLYNISKKARFKLVLRSMLRI